MGDPLPRLTMKLANLAIFLVVLIAVVVLIRWLLVVL